ncbi:hypothetical protein [Aquipuribacter sp. SD81]|uniref:hypothetical protein n=1 Tax=Aquipuribacter sp. SD81 TaxID=3127703 RepID=UPI003015AB30
MSAVGRGVGLVVAGVALGVVIGVAVASGPGPREDAARGGPPGPVASDPAPQPVTAECVEAAERTATVLELAESAAAAMADLDAAELEQVVERMRAEDVRAREALERCRSAEEVPALPLPSPASSYPSARPSVGP